LGTGERIVKNTGFVLISAIVEKIFSMVFIVYAARILGPKDLGIYTLICTVAVLFSFFGNIGIGPMAIREIAQHKTKAEELFNHILTLRMSLISLSYLLLVLIVNLLGYHEDVRYLIYVAGLSTIFSTFSHCFSILYTAFERFKIPSLVSILVSFLSTVSNILALYLGYGVKGIIWVSFFGSVVGVVISGLWIRYKFFKYRFVIHLATWKSLISQSLPFFLITFMHAIRMNASVLLLSKLPGPLPGEVAIGYYRPASSVCQAALMVSSSFQQAAFPAISSNIKDLDLIKIIIRKTTKTFLLLIIFPLILLTTFFPKEIITLIFGNKYLPSAFTLTILGWAHALMVFNSPISIALSATKNVYRFVPWTLLLLVISIVLSVPLIIYYSYTGAAIAVLISWIIDTIIRNYLMKNIIGIQNK
jgi:O-antigen/teichoic acid export membrane protein